MTSPTAKPVVLASDARPVSLPRPPAPSAPSQTKSPSMQMPGASHTGSRVVFVATEGYGKTSTGALAEKPVIIMAPDELGYLTLHQHGLVPAVPTMQPKSWLELLACIEHLAKEPHDRKTVVLDAMVGLEALCAWHVCQQEFKGDWGESGFQAYGRGKGIVARTWPAIFPRLTACANRGMNVLVLGHAKVQAFRNPDGADFDRFECNVATEVWGRTKAWAEAVLFGNFRALVDEAKVQSNKAKAKGKAIGQERILRCQYSAMADAKNQYGLGPEYSMPDDPAQFAEAFWGMVTSNKKEQ